MEGLNRGKNNLIGKLHSERTIRREVLFYTMRKVWRTTKPFTIQDIGTDSYVFSLEENSDMQRILRGKPWLFDTSLLSLQHFDGCTPPAKMSFSKEEFWVQFHNLPLGCMNANI